MTFAQPWCFSVGQSTLVDVDIACSIESFQTRRDVQLGCMLHESLENQRQVGIQQSIIRLGGCWRESERMSQDQSFSKDVEKGSGPDLIHPLLPLSDSMRLFVRIFRDPSPNLIRCFKKVELSPELSQPPRYDPLHLIRCLRKNRANGL